MTPLILFSGSIRKPQMLYESGLTAHLYSKAAILIPALLLMLFLLPAHARNSDSDYTDGQAYYLVFEQGEDNVPRLVYQRLVQIAPSPPGDTKERVWAATSSAPTLKGPLIASVVSKSGERVFQKIVHLDREIRAEFAGPDGSLIERYEVPSQSRSFVLRIPAYSEGTLSLEDHSITTFSIAAIAAEAARTGPHNERAQSSILSNGEPSNRVDILIMGDGYKASETALFEADVLNFNDNFFAISPYLEYRSFINSVSLFVPSIENGADHPFFDAGCPALDLRCCTDPAAGSDPSAGTMADTAFDATYCKSNLHRLMGVNDTKVYIAASAYPGWDKLFVLVNDPVYGGAGGAVSIASTHPQGTGIFQHEYGHSFSALADEYETPFPAARACSDLPEDPGIQACQANVTNETDRSEIKWGPWIEESTPVPTPGSEDYIVDIGLFEGARYLASDMYRPRQSCAMRTQGGEFCQICQQQYVLRLYQGGWGDPVTGIDLIEPGSETPAPGAFDSTGPVRLSIEVLQPLGGVSIVWKVGGIAQAGENSAHYIFYPAADGLYEVEVEVSDPTTKVHPDMEPAGALSSTRSWMVTADVDAAIPISAGMNDAWISTDAPFQGLFFTVFPESEIFFLSWFTFDSEVPPGDDTAVFGAFDQRWVTGSGQYFGNRAAINVELTSGGIFNDSVPRASQETAYGTITTVFTSCSEAVLFYDFPSKGLTGQSTLNRILPDNAAMCTAFAAGGTNPDEIYGDERMAISTKSASVLPFINAGMNDAWISADAPFQGLFFTVYPDAGIFFLSWFTFDSEIPLQGDAPAFGASDQRWVTGSGFYSGNRVTIDMESTSGGIFRGADPLASQDSAYGTVNIEFISCDEALLSYNFLSVGLSSEMTLTRVLPDNAALCIALAAP